MLAVTTTDSLACLDTAQLKSSSSSVPSCLSLITPPTAAQWSTDNSALYLASTNTIQKYDPSINSLKDMHSLDATISHLLVKDRSSLIFASAEKVHVLENSTVKLVSSHSSSITSIAISVDSSLLASTSSTAVYVLDFTLGSQTILRGLSLANNRINACVFHTHTRTKLLLGIGKQLVVYDTSRPSGPIKTIPMNDSCIGDIIAVACSPFSKTLVACCTSGGNVGLVDLDKEKGLFRTLNIKTPLTSMTFSSEGATLYLGTQNGKLLMLDLRSLEKAPKSIVISRTGARIETMSIQKKLKASESAAVRINVSKETTRKASASCVGQKGLSPRPTKSASVIGRSPVNTGSARLSPGKEAAQKVNSPGPDPGRPILESSQVDNPSTRRRETSSKLKASPPVKRIKTSDAPKSSGPSKGPLSTSTSATSLRNTATRVQAQTRKAPSTQNETLSAGHRSRLSTSDSSSPSITSESVSADQPHVHDEPTTPLRNKSTAKTEVTPEVDQWIGKLKGTREMNGKGKEKSVGGAEENKENEIEDECEADSMAMQLSPRRPVQQSAAPFQNSPLRQVITNSSAGSAQELLRGVVREAMYDFQQETRAELTNLHLDLVRAGRGWKRELRLLMEEYIGDLKDLRDENKKLREENERLRRGY